MPHTHCCLHAWCCVCIRTHCCNPAATYTSQMGALLCINGSATLLISESLSFTWVCQKLGHLPERSLHKGLSIWPLASMGEGRIHNEKIFPNVEGFSRYDKRSWQCHMSTPVIPVIGRQPFFIFILWMSLDAPSFIQLLFISIAGIPSNSRKRTVSLEWV